MGQGIKKLWKKVIEKESREEEGEEGGKRKEKGEGTGERSAPDQPEQLVTARLHLLLRVGLDD